MPFVRFVPILLISLIVGACGNSASTNLPTNNTAPALDVPEIYRARQDIGPNGEPIAIAAVRPAYLTERNRRQVVPYNGPEAPGTIIVDPYARVLYHVQPNGQAVRYGVAVGRAGTGFEGRATIARKAAWPSWRPTNNMIRTQPELYAQFASGVPGGPTNPLGSRALYLYQGGTDTYYRIHGTMDPSSIGKATSAGCIRLFNQDVIDLFDTIPTGTQVIVRSQSESIRYEGPMRETPEGYVVPAASGQSSAYAATAQTATAIPDQTPNYTEPELNYTGPDMSGQVTDPFATAS